MTNHDQTLPPVQPNKRAALQALIDRKCLSAVFQPIVDLASCAIHGYEALIRGPVGTDLSSPDQLFAAAACNQQLAALEYACREAACTAFAELNLPGKLFLNMTPLSFADPHYRDGVTMGILRWLQLDPERVVFELTEKEPLDDTELLRSACEHFRAQGFAVALDDLGAGYAGLRVWSELRPQYVKIDRHFIAGIDRDPVKREFVHAIMDIARRIGNKVVAEGVETEEELRTALAIGIEYVQGYYLARPTAQPSTEVPEHLYSSVRDRMPQLPITLQRTLRDITTSEQGLRPDLPAAEAVKMFRADIRLGGLPVVDGNKALGIVSRSELLNAFSVPFAYELHGKKPLADFISARGLIMDVNCNLNVAGRVIAEDPAQNLNMDVVVCEDGGEKGQTYLGVAKVRSILATIAEDQLRAARHSNSLTGLPGNVPLYEWIDRLLADHKPFVIAYCDINNFKPYNDVFGYSRGDDVIISLGELLRSQTDAERDFIGHIGGDDFIVVFRSQDWYRRCEALLHAVEAGVWGAARADDAQFFAADRQGNWRWFGPLTLTIACVRADSCKYRDHRSLAHALAGAKRHAKSLGGNRLFVAPSLAGADSVTQCG